MLAKAFIQGDSVFTSILYKDPSKNKGGQPFKLPDYSSKSADPQTWSEIHENDIVWRKRHSVEKELAQYQFHFDVELLTNMLQYYLATDFNRNREFFWQCDIDDRVPKEMQLYYKLAMF